MRGRTILQTMAAGFLTACLIHPALGEALAPGLHERLPFEEPSITYTLYLPKSYTPKSSLPVAIIPPGEKSESSDWAKERMTAWAERNNAAVFIVDSGAWPKAFSLKHKDDNSFGIRMWMTALNKIPGLDPIVRVAVSAQPDRGRHGTDVLTAMRLPGAIAGAAYDFEIGNIVPEYHASSYLATVELHPTRAALARTREAGHWGIAYRMIEEYDRPRMHAEWDRMLHPANSPSTVFENSGLDALDPDVMDDTLDYLLDAVLLTHPRLSPARHKEALAMVARRLNEARAESNPWARYRILDVLSRLPLQGAIKTEAVDAWRAAGLAAIAPQPDVLTRHDFVKSLLADPRMKGAKELKEVKEQLAELEKDPQCKREIAAHEAAQDVFWRVWAGTQGAVDRQMGRPSRIPVVRWVETPEEVKLLEQIMKDYPDTYGAKEAKFEHDFRVKAEAKVKKKK